MAHLNQQEQAARFRQLHQERPLVLPNAWDAASARVIEQVGASAIATTSAAMSWVHGKADGEHLKRGEMIDAVRRIVQAVTVPVSADIESGYGTGTVYDVAETVRAVLDAGAVGINLEDSPGRHGQVLRRPEEQAERIMAARSTARLQRIDLFINARIDVYLLQAAPPLGCFEETVRRAHIYRQAGADCLFVPGVVDGAVIKALADAVGGPLNIMASAGSPTAGALGKLGVARLSVGPAICQAALGAARRAAHELLTCGSYSELEDALPFPDANSMFAAVR